MNEGGDVLLTVEEAVKYLDPPVTAEVLRKLIDVTGLQAEGKRRRSGPGRPALTYSLQKLARLHAANIPLIHQFSVPVSGA